MGKIINLRQLRKQQTRDQKARAGTENAARHGRSKVEKALDQAEANKLRSHLDQHRLDK